MHSLKYLLSALAAGRLLKRAKVLFLYSYYLAIEKINPRWGLERPRFRVESDPPTPVERDRTSGIEIHLVSDHDARAEFGQPDARRQALVTRIADKFRTARCFTCDAALTPMIQVVNAADAADFIEVAWCPSCDGLQYSVMPSKAWISGWYASFWDSTGTTDEKLEERRTTYRYFHRLAPYLPKRKLRVLDIGAGYGEKIRPFAEAGHEVHCTEATTRRAEYLRQHVTPHVYFGTLDTPDVRESLRRNGPFDLIFSYHVVEHIYDARKELQILRDIAADNAIFHLAIPEFYKEGILNNVYALEHVASFSRRAAKTLLAQVGFETVVAKDDLFQYYSNYCQFLIGRKARNGNAVTVERNPDPERCARYLAEALRLDTLAGMNGSTFSYRYNGHRKLTYRISNESKAKCRNVGGHLPIRIYHHDLPLFWMQS
ncbi:MAG: class I SAM-dependent methyltransferase [Gemmatimonas sp.]